MEARAGARALSNPMSSALEHAWLHFLSSHTFSQLTTTVTALGVIVLIVLFVEREILEAGRTGRHAAPPRTFDIVIVPLLILFLLVVVGRFVKLA